MNQWNSVWFEDIDGENIAHYELLETSSVKSEKPSKRVSKAKGKVGRPKGSKTVTKGKKRGLSRSKSAKTVTDRAVFTRLNKLLASMPQFVKTSEVRTAYKAKYKENLTLKKTVRDRVLVKYGTKYENLVFHKNRKLKVVSR